MGKMKTLKTIAESCNLLNGMEKTWSFGSEECPDTVFQKFLSISQKNLLSGKTGYMRQIVGETQEVWLETFM